MRFARTFVIVARDLKMGPRSPIFLWVILTPVLITFMLQVVFITLFDPMPRLGIADLGRSEITLAIEQMECPGEVMRSAVELSKRPTMAVGRRPSGKSRLRRQDGAPQAHPKHLIKSPMADMPCLTGLPASH